VFHWFFWRGLLFGTDFTGFTDYFSAPVIWASKLPLRRYPTGNVCKNLSFELYLILGLERITLKLLRQPGLLQHSIGGVAGFDVVIDNKFYIGYGTKPNLMISLTLTVESATGIF